jgi:hypothetical protein
MTGNYAEYSVHENDNFLREKKQKSIKKDVEKFPQKTNSLYSDCVLTVY